MLTRKNFFSIALLAFGIFFGAGNLMFPPAVAQAAGSNVWLAFIGFFITAVALPVLGIVAVAKTDGLLNLGKRVDPIFAYIVTIGILIAIGPGLAIPRTGTTSYQMAFAPYLSDGLQSTGLLIYSLVFFLAVTLVAWSPNKIVDRIGKITTPALLLLIGTMTVIVVMGPKSPVSQASQAYLDRPVVEGFLAGYNTLDTLAGLNYGLLIVTALRSYKVAESKIISLATKAGLIAGLVLTLVYLCLTLIGQVGAGLVDSSANGADILFASSQSILGQTGSLIFGLIFVLACFNTCVGLVTSISQFFSQIMPFLPYRAYVIILVIWSILLANVGLDGILAYSVPVLILLYPIGITLIILNLTENWLKHNQLAYRVTAYLVTAISVIASLQSMNITLPFFTNLVDMLPFASVGLSWVLPVLVSLLIFALINRNNRSSQS